jgi:hypothetical protein
MFLCVHAIFNYPIVHVLLMSWFVPSCLPTFVIYKPLWKAPTAFLHTVPYTFSSTTRPRKLRRCHAWTMFSILLFHLPKVVRLRWIVSRYEISTRIYQISLLISSVIANAELVELPQLQMVGYFNARMINYQQLVPFYQRDVTSPNATCDPGQI